MTWVDWCHSDYNIVNAIATGTIINGILYSHVQIDVYSICNCDLTEEPYTNTIISNNSYTLILIEIG